MESKYRNISWILAGDTNDLKLDSILLLNKKLKQVVTSPTRLQPPAVLDVVITDLHMYYGEAQCLPPLEVPDGHLH